MSIMGAVNAGYLLTRFERKMILGFPRAVEWA